MNRLVVQCLVLGALLAALGGCVAPSWMKKKQPGVTTLAPNGTPVHASWCYETLAQVDCYDRPQDFPPGRLVSVDPPRLIPLTPEQYDKALADSRLAQGL